MTLQGRRLMIAQETDMGCVLNEATIKMLTGGDAVTGRGMYENFSSFLPTHKLMLCTNHKPRVLGRDYAIWRRLKLIPFTVRFEGDQADKAMPEKLKAEDQGILAWMVRGCLDWLRGGLQEPECVQIATTEYAEEQDAVGQFIKEYCRQDDDLWEWATKLWEAFKTANPDTTMTQTSFGTELGERGFAATHATQGPHKGRKIRRGLRLLASG